VRSSTETLIAALQILARDIKSDDGVANAAIAEAADRLAELERENAELKQRILDDNKAYGCELMDPSGTIWDHAKRLQDENAALRADKERLDWLDHNAIPWNWMSTEKINGLGQIVVTWKSNRTLRAAIDAARKEAQP